MGEAGFPGLTGPAYLAGAAPAYAPEERVLVFPAEPLAGAGDDAHG